MVLAIIAIVLGLAVLVWSADRFVDGASATAEHFAVPPLLIGMVIVGFGTSVPELVVSAFAASQGNPGIALGNAYGSNITNIALILGLTAMLKPIAVHSQVIRKELPILLAVTGLAGWQVYSGSIGRLDATLLLLVFTGLMGWTIYEGVRRNRDSLGDEIEQELKSHRMTIRQAILWLIVGLLLLMVSSRALVWGAVEIAHALEVSDLLIGLTVVAVGTSLPELASTIAASRRGESDIALGNVIGSNLFNTLAVVGLAGVIHPMEVPAAVFYRDVMVMAGLTLYLFVGGYSFGGEPRINRYEGAVLLLSYVVYTAYLIKSAFVV